MSDTKQARASKSSPTESTTEQQESSSSQLEPSSPTTTGKTAKTGSPAVKAFKRSYKWTEDQMNTILGVLAIHNSAYDDAVAELAGLELEITKPQLITLKKTHAERYIAIATELQPKLQAARAEQLAQVAELAHQREVEILNALDVSEMNAKDLGNTLRNISTSKGIALQHHDKLTGHAPVVQDTRNIHEMMNSIARDFKGVITVTQSVEIKPEDPTELRKVDQ